MLHSRRATCLEGLGLAPLRLSAPLLELRREGRVVVVARNLVKRSPVMSLRVAMRKAVVMRRAGVAKVARVANDFLD